MNGSLLYADCYCTKYDVFDEFERRLLGSYVKIMNQLPKTSSFSPSPSSSSSSGNKSNVPSITAIPNPTVISSFVSFVNKYATTGSIFFENETNQMDSNINDNNNDNDISTATSIPKSGLLQSEWWSGESGRSILSMGTFYGILTNKSVNHFDDEDKPYSYSSSPLSFEISERHFVCYLHSISSDNSMLLKLASDLGIERWDRLNCVSKMNILWLLDNSVSFGMASSDSLFQVLLKCVSLGDFSADNLWLIHSLISFLEKNFRWFLRINNENNDIQTSHETSRLIPIVLYSILTWIPDHHSFLSQPLLHDPSQKDLIQRVLKKEIGVSVFLLKTKFSICCSIGRDLIRLLLSVARIPEFSSIWADLITRKGSSSDSPDLGDILMRPTHPMFITCAIPPALQTRIVFLLSNVNLGNQERYQNWISSNYLSSAESESLIPTLIRFIVCCFHPPNQVLCSNILPRWAFIGWLLKSVRTPHMAANAKLSLFFDWFFFDKNRGESLMTIEPGMLLMIRSISQYAGITATLAEFLVKEADFFFPANRQLMEAGIVNSFDVMLQSGVMSSSIIDNLLDSPFIHPSIRSRLSEWKSHLQNSIQIPPTDQPNIQLLNQPPPLEIQPLEDIDPFKDIEINELSGLCLFFSASRSLVRNHLFRDFLPIFSNEPPNKSLVRILEASVDVIQEPGDRTFCSCPNQDLCYQDLCYQSCSALPLFSRLVLGLFCKEPRKRAWLPADWTIGNVDLIHTTVSLLDPSLLLELQLSLLQGTSTIFAPHGEDILHASLEWETYEQVSLWQLFSSESSGLHQSQDISFLANLLTKLDRSRHFEALSAILSILSRIWPPPQPIVRAVGEMNSSFSLFKDSLLGLWAHQRRKRSNPSPVQPKLLKKMKIGEVLAFHGARTLPTPNP